MASKQYSTEEHALLEAGLRYSRASKVPLTKVAWGLASVLGRQDSDVYHRMQALADGSFYPLEELDEDIEAEELHHRVGEIVSARVVTLKSYGALCIVEGTTRALLLHVSEIADEFIDDVGSYVEVGDTVQALLVVSGREDRLALSTKRIGSVKRKRPRA